MRITLSSSRAKLCAGVTTLIACCLIAQIEELFPGLFEQKQMEVRERAKHLLQKTSRRTLRDLTARKRQSIAVIASDGLISDMQQIQHEKL